MDLKLQFNTLKSEHKMNPYSSVRERKQLLLSLKKGLQTDAVKLARAVNKDFKHRSMDETLFLELFPAIRAIDYCVKNLKKWMTKKKRNVSWLFLPAYAYVLPQPLGVVGVIVPWNYPLFLALGPAIYALAAGNRVMIKMSELSPETGLVLKLMIDSLGLSDYIAVVLGDVEVSKQFAALPFGHLLFTGSTEVGKSVMKSASDNLTPVTLELGGKSPVILSSTMNPKYFTRMFMGKLFNAGQTCIAPDYFLIPPGWEERFENELSSFLEVHYPQLMNNDDYSSIINPTHKHRLLSLVDDARRKGARVVEFGSFDPESSKIPVYLMFGVNNDMRVMQEEIFGPLIPVMHYSFINEAVEYINASPNPLALYYFGNDTAEMKFIRTKTLSGALTINETLMHVGIDDLPFGGVGHSGMGHYHGQEGFETFSKLKPVMVQRRFSGVSWLYPPYGKLMHLFLAWVGGIKLKENK